MSTVTTILIIALCYIWGSIPFGYLLVKKVSHKNILEHGSGNIGSTNVGRIAGKKWSLITQILDMIKGLLPVALFLILNKQEHIQETYLVYLLAIATILGHNFSVFLKFRGGKGVNTTLGAAVFLAPVPVFSAVAVFFLIKWRFKFVSIGSLVLGATLPLVEFLLKGTSPTFYFLMLCMLLIAIRHYRNIRRLVNKKELSA